MSSRDEIMTKVLLWNMSQPRRRLATQIIAASIDPPMMFLENPCASLREPQKFSVRPFVTDLSAGSGLTNPRTHVRRSGSEWPRMKVGELPNSPSGHHSRGPIPLRTTCCRMA